MENEEKHFTGAVNVKQAYVWMRVSRAIARISTSDLINFFMHIQDVQLMS
jgi:hypothetical protein